MLIKIFTVTALSLIAASVIVLLGSNRWDE